MNSLAVTNREERSRSMGGSARPGSVLVTLGVQVLVTRAGGPQLVLTGKAAAMVALVGLDDPVDRRRVAQLLWPDSSESQARNNLRTLVHRLNRRVGAELLVGGERLGLDGALVRLVQLEADDLLAPLGAGGVRDFELLSGAGVKSETSEAFDAWLQATRQRLRRLQLDNLHDALVKAEESGDAPRAIALARACVQLEPFSEQWHRQLMTTLARFGDRAAALAAYEDLKDMLRRHLGVSPDVQSRTVHLRILQGQALGRAGSADDIESPKPPSPAPPANPQPAQSASRGRPHVTLDETREPPMAGLTPLGGAARYALVERDEVLERLRDALDRGLHVALHGEPGVGKTRLLRHLGERSKGLEQIAIFPGAREEPYAAVAQLLQEVQPRRGARVAVADQVELARLAPLAFPDAQPSEARLFAPCLHAALGRWVRALSEAGVRWLVLDDLHYADAASQAALAALLSPAIGIPCAGPSLVLSWRSGEVDPTLGDAMIGAQVHGQAKSIALPRLTLEGVRSLLRAIGVVDSLAEPYLLRTGGNPLFVIELAQHAMERGNGRMSADLNALLVWRLRGCSPDAQQLAAVAAVAGKDFSVELAASVTSRAPLALMPAWSELQQRGLFADHGLAHDLVCEAVLGALPSSIGRTLHGRVATWMEAQGLKGAQVLRHWLAAGTPDCALPHAVQQLHATGASGLSTLQIEADLIGLLSQVTDRVLLDNLWLTAEAGSSLTADFVLPEVWPRLRDLLARVRTLPDAESVAGWIAFESARQKFHVERSVKEAWDLLNQAAARTPPQGIARTRIEQKLAFCARIVHGDGRVHARRAREALAGLPDHPHLRRIRLAVDRLEAADLSAAEVIKKTAPKMRAARRRGDMAGVFEARVQIALAHAHSGSDGHAYRHFRMAARTKVPGEACTDRFESLSTVGIVALKAGRFDVALRCFQDVRDAEFLDDRPAFLALTWLRMGQVSRARELAREIEPGLIRRSFLTVLISAHVQAALDDLEGADPLPALKRAHEFMAGLGIDGVNLGLMSWEVALRTRSASERWAEGQALIRALRAQGASCSRLLRLLIGVAEAGAEIGEPHETLVREAAWMLRRGCASLNLYVPDGFDRCASLLEATDPREAVSLRHVALRWLMRAMRHVEPEARESFSAILVNRRLLAPSSVA